MVRAAVQPDVLVLGSHPCAYFAAALLRQNSSCRVIVGSIADARRADEDDRLVTLNPELFDLHKSLSALKRELDLTAVYGVRFLSDDPKTSSEFVSRRPVFYISTFGQVRDAIARIAERSRAELAKNDSLEIHRADEHGVHVTLDGRALTPRLLIVSDELPAPARRVLGLAESWEPGVLHRYTYVTCKATRGMEFGTGTRPLAPMSLDLKGRLTWGWALPGGAHVQFAVEEPVERTDSASSRSLLKHWLDVLTNHGVLRDGSVPNVADAVSMNLPLGGALVQEDVANRTLLIGPAGGFYSACAEDVYPACWSAVFAAETARRALAEKHLQDALQTYRQKWGSTLGDYLRGPQQNLRFLLPLVYRNKMMTMRLAEAIVFGKSVVR
jgi:hypothetical protein